MDRRARARLGFTLLEMSIVLVIIAVVAGAGAALLTASLKRQQFQETQAKLEAIQKALLDYRRAYNRLPCPSDITIAAGALNFGLQAAKTSTTSTTDYGCMAGTPAANFNNGANMFRGGVPVRTLALPDEYAYDGWGRAIDYNVDGTATAASAFTTITLIDTTGRFEIYGSPDRKVDKAIYVLVSFGENGHGAYTRAGGTTTVNAGSANAYEAENCDCDTDGVRAATINQVFAQKPTAINKDDVTDSFDDIAVYATRSELRLPTE